MEFTARTLSIGMVSLIAAAISTAIGVYVHIQSVAASSAREAVYQHELKRINEAHTDIATWYSTRGETQEHQKEISVLKDQIEDLYRRRAKR